MGDELRVYVVSMMYDAYGDNWLDEPVGVFLTREEAEASAVNATRRRPEFTFEISECVIGRINERYRP